MRNIYDSDAAGQVSIAYSVTRVSDVGFVDLQIVGGLQLDPELRRAPEES